MLWRLRIHGLTRLLLVARRRWRILPGLLLPLRWVLIALLLRLLLVVGQRLSVCTIELGVGWRLLAAPDCVGGHKGLRLGRDGREHAFLREALAVGAATVFGLIEPRAADLPSPTVSACDRSPLAWCGLGRCGIAHRRAVAGVHLCGRRQRTVRILHDGWMLRLRRDGLRE